MLALISIKPIGRLMVTLVNVVALVGRPIVTGHCQCEAVRIDRTSTFGKVGTATKPWSERGGCTIYRKGSNAIESLTQSV